MKAITIADFLVDNRDNLTHKRLQREVYLINEIYFRKNNKSLFKENIYKLTQGPTIKEISRKYIRYGNKTINLKINHQFNIKDEDRNFLLKMSDILKNKSNMEINELIQASTAYKKTNKGKIIDKNLLKE